jgi:DNA-binding transcriptional ArsR family regulator
MVVHGCNDEGDCCGDVLRERLSVDLFKALGDPSRLTILASLAQAAQPLRVSEIGTCCPQDISVVSRHLAVLRQAGVVEAHRRGREVLYRLRSDSLVGFLRELADALEACCPPNRVEREPG